MRAEGIKNCFMHFLLPGGVHREVAQMSLLVDAVLHREVGCYLASPYQPRREPWHRSSMPGRLFISAIAVSLLAFCTACSPNQSPDQIREKTAEETAKIKRDTKAIAQGVKEGLSNKRS